MEVMWLGGTGFVLGGGAAFVLGSSARRVVTLLAVGVLLAAALFGLAWATAAPSAGEADYSCSDCGQWLGRWWEGWLVLVMLGFNLLGWWAGVLVGAAARRAVRPRGGSAGLDTSGVRPWTRPPET